MKKIVVLFMLTALALTSIAYGEKAEVESFRKGNILKNTVKFYEFGIYLEVDDPSNHNLAGTNIADYLNNYFPKNKYEIIDVLFDFQKKEVLIIYRKK